MACESHIRSTLTDSATGPALLRNGGRPGLDCVVARSDGEGEFGEGDREPMLWVLSYAEFVVVHIGGSAQGVWR